MTGQPVYIVGAGIVSPLGRGMAATEEALRNNRSALAPLRLFPLLHGQPLPVGQLPDAEEEDWPPRTHRLAREATKMAMEGATAPPDAVILGCTTGGILTTERLLRHQVTDKAAYRGHGLLSLAEDVADCCGCTGPALTVSTACSSGTVAIALAMALLRQGRMRRILVGGVDSLSRLTYFGFHSLQLVDHNGCRPLDSSRQGLAVAEGAAMLLLTAESAETPMAVLLGAGLSCDAYHPTAPHPEGLGALKAMQAALNDAGLSPVDIDYINLHGTGTRDNDLAEARAIRALFPTPPPLSSIKGATGHSLAAAGAIEAVVSVLAVTRGFLPGNTGCLQPDPALGLVPVQTTTDHPVRTVLSNSFGFGGNNGSLVIGAAGEHFVQSGQRHDQALAVHGFACLTGAGLTHETLDRLKKGASVAGLMAAEQIEQQLPPRLIRRLRRLARLTLLLADSARKDAATKEQPSAIFMGTGWGALSETYAFLERLTESGEQFPSPTDFVGSVHNGPAGQAALFCKATGANVTASGGDYSFEQALLAAQGLLGHDQSALLIGADEGHLPLSPLLDPSISPGQPLADGGGAFYVNRDRQEARCLIRLAFYGRGGQDSLPGQMIAALGGAAHIQSTYAAVFAGVPAGTQEIGNSQLTHFFNHLGSSLPLWRYRDCTGEFASAAAVAVCIAASFLQTGTVPGTLIGAADLILGPEQRLLVLGTGTCLTAMELFRP